MFCKNGIEVMMSATSFIYLLPLTLIAGELNNECKRQCISGESLKCQYNFVVTEAHNLNINESEDCENSADSVLLINGLTPGPAIEICLGDSVEIFVHNKLLSTEISFHWHGISQQGSSHMDGVAMITQCPILPFTSFRYDFKPDSNGTYFYHAHSIYQQADGLHGALIVNSPSDDQTLQNTFILSAKSDDISPLSSSQSAPIALTINGKMNNAEWTVRRGNNYRLRLINANIFCPLALFIDEHPLTIIAVGSTLVKETETRHVIIFPGERIDLTLNANRQGSKYRMVVQGLESCRHLIHEAALTYDSAESNISFPDKDDAPLHYLDVPEELQAHDCASIEKNTLCSLDLKTTSNVIINNDPADIYYIPFDINYYPAITDDMTDYTFNIYGYSYYPSYLTIKNNPKVPQINKMSFKYPSSPILSQPEAIAEDQVCTIDDRSSACRNNPEFCECLQILQVPVKKTVEIIMIDEGNGGNRSHVFHTHGYAVNVIGHGSFGRAITRDEIVSLDESNQLPRNFIDPPKMDTFVVPNKGYVILNFYTDNIGYWLWEFRSIEATHAPAMQFVLQVGNQESMPTVPIDFPTCGNHKGPDLIFEDD
ncbi:uncharacterized protein LOC103578067 isoform X2 [Microplitis demolitor]|uniref:uncharacterized protein LOC103578067 isoform X2 n=1 Tax=Microplitis demolitor TaxID=69319 RepID=UPI0006D4F436|nr:uncharacterized protein LOC103578067 isoform X2 [Microplitis demolitor]